ncbi:crossover junction endodeoxyribonuclease RuvC [Myxococcota bacterium]|nr:crossover junction endodeoxyribonuclease RuvC [Myxococcota bacterium]
MRILGVDPGSVATGFGSIERLSGRLVHRRHGVLRPPPAASLASRLAYLHAELLAIVRGEAPDAVVVERVFLASNPRSALVLGQARGAVLACLGEAGVTVVELSARQVKKSVTGSGGADKAQVQSMVVRLLSLAEIPPADAADALALALTHAQAGPLAELPLRTRRRSSRQAMTRLVMERMS